jgi:trans-aconitate methyltransferase
MTSSTQRPDIGFIPTPQPMLDTILALAEVGQDDYLYDLGSGDGRLLIQAAQQFRARGVGIEIDPQLIKKSQERAISAGVQHLLEFRQQNLFDCTFSQATIVYLYLLPRLNLRLLPKLRQLPPGTRIVTRDFDLGDWKPQKQAKITVDEEEATFFYWQL